MTMIRRMFMLALAIPLSFTLFLKAEEAGKTSPLVGRVGDHALTEDQMISEAGLGIYEAEMQAYNAKKAWVERKAREILFEKAAMDAKLSQVDWKAKEIDNKILTPTDADVDQRAQQWSRGQLPTDPVQLANVKTQARSSLLNERRTSRENELYAQLAASATIQFLMAKPPLPNVKIYTKDNPVKGPENAPVTIVEFTDFQCPWCSRSQESVHSVLNAYPDKIKFITRHFPLTQMHPRAMPAAEAAACVQEQGKFWEYHDKVFANQQNLSDEDLARYAKEVGVNEKKFNACVKNHKTRALVEKDQADGIAYGVQGTPTFFVNNQKANFNQLTDLVRENLAAPK